MKNDFSTVALVERAFPRLNVAASPDATCRIKPLRKLFEEIPQLIQELKPCLLMSPLSVANYLGPSPYRFDVVIFDEASQILPADAIGSTLRGACLIVAGDDK